MSALTRGLPGLLFALAAAAAPPEPARIDRVFAAFGANSPGCALGVIENGVFAYKKGYGLASLEHGVPITERTAFYLGSTSKQFTAMTVLRLAAAGRVSLDDPLRKYIPEAPAYMAPVTLRHLLGHTSGVRDYMSLLTLAGLADDDNVTEPRVTALLQRQKPLAFPPGSEFLYSNSGYFLLAAAMKRAIFRPFPELAAELVFTPLGMRSTRYVVSRHAVIPNRATAYAASRDGAWRVNNALLEAVGDGGVFTTVEDLLAWDRVFTGGAAGWETLAAQMTEPAALSDGRRLPYGKGLMLRSYRGLEAVSHAGGLRGYKSEILRFPREKMTIVCLCNTVTAEPARLARQVADVWLEGRFVDLKGGPVAGAEKLAGKWRDRATGEVLEITAEKERLYARFGGAAVELQPGEPGRYRTWRGPLDIEVEFADGQPKFWRVEAEFEKPADFEPAGNQPVPGVKAEDYAGRYRSEELGAVWELRAAEDAIEVRVGEGVLGRLEPLGAERFRMPLLNIEFWRDEEKRVTGFRLNAGRVRGIRFERTP